MKVKELIEKLNKCNPELEAMACFESDDILKDNGKIISIALIDSFEENDEKYLVLIHE